MNHLILGLFHSADLFVSETLFHFKTITFHSKSKINIFSKFKLTYPINRIKNLHIDKWISWAAAVKSSCGMSVKLLRPLCWPAIVIFSNRLLFLFLSCYFSTFLNENLSFVILEIFFTFFRRCSILAFKKGSFGFNVVLATWPRCILQFWMSTTACRF